MLKIGSHVSMSGKDMFLNSVKEAAATVPTPLCFTPVRRKIPGVSQSKN